MPPAHHRGLAVVYLLPPFFAAFFFAISLVIKIFFYGADQTPQLQN
jgi:hypothetical protein